MLAWGVLLSYAALIFYLSSKPIDEELSVFPQFDKLLHFFAYSFFGWIAYQAMNATWRNVSAKNLIVAASCLAIIYGATDEFHQLFVPTRSGSLADLVADAVGATFGGWFLTKPNRFLYGDDTQNSKELSNT